MEKVEGLLACLKSNVKYLGVKKIQKIETETEEYPKFSFFKIVFRLS